MANKDSFEGRLTADCLIALAWVIIGVSILRCGWLGLRWLAQPLGNLDMAFWTTAIIWPAFALLMIAAAKLVRLVGTIEWRGRQPHREPPAPQRQSGEPDWNLLRAAGGLAEPQQVIGAGIERHDKP